MSKVYIGLDTHKEHITIAVSLDHGEAIVHGSCSSDLQRFLTALRVF